MYDSISNARRNLFWKAADGSGPEEALTTSPFHQTAGSWSGDGKWLVYQESHPATAEDIFLLPLEGQRKPQPFLVTPASEIWPRISLDGRWISYSSRESGAFQIYVQPFRGKGPRIQVSTEEASMSDWAADGRELFYQSATKLMAVEIRTQPELAVGQPKLLFDRPDLTGGLDVASSGRFVIIQGASKPRPHR